MAATPPLGGGSRSGTVLGPALDKIIKNASWRKHANLISACKSALDSLDSINDSTESSASPLASLSAADSELALQALTLAVESAYPKVVEPALDCVNRLFSFGIFRGDIDARSDDQESLDPASKLMASICGCGAIGDEGVELSMLRVVVAAIRSTNVVFRGEALVQIVRCCYNVYLGSQSANNQVCARVVLAQIMVFVFARAEVDAMEVRVPAVSIADMLDLSDKNLNDSSLMQSAQNFIKEVMGGSETQVFLEKPHKGEEVMSEANGRVDTSSGLSKIQEDAIFLFKNLCKLSMKFSTHEGNEDHLLLRGKVLSLELLKMVIDNVGPTWRTNERFARAVKQCLCLSLVKNSALSAMSIFQLLCSIFLGLLTKFRYGLKGDIGIFFQMLILRVLENVTQPSFVQKMTVLSLLEKICQDSQVIVDIFMNYDCDVDAPNIFERIVNGLVKTALGVPSGSATTLTPAQDLTFRNESVRCLATIMKTMGDWMNQQLRVQDLSSNSPDSDHYLENHSILNEDGMGFDFESHPETNSENSDAVTLEQRRAYKLELQKGISIFNRKPSKGIEFLISMKKIGGTPEEVALFLKNTAGLNETVIGDYLGERDEFPLKVMHAYVDSIDFEGMDFGEAIRFFLRGFRLPGEAQKIDRIMEKFAERYCKCNPSSFTRADTAYVLAYSVIMLNTDAHNTMVKDKMSKADFIRNNRGIDDGKNLPEEYLGSLYNQIVKSEIKMRADCSVPQNKQTNGINKLLGLDSIFNLINWRPAEEKALGANDLLIKHIQEQIKANSNKTESVFYAVTDPAILRFMMEVCWAPMLAAFSVTLDQSDDKAATSQCLVGFRYAIHVTSVLRMQTQRDAFVTSVAKFTYLHCAADMKQKNVDAVKTIISIAIEDGNYLQEAWEHVLTCLSRFEHLHLLGEGSLTDASFFTVPRTETVEKLQKPPGIPSLKKKGNTLQNPAVMAIVRGSSYDSSSFAANASGLVTPEQINSFISNLNLLDQIGSFELNHIFTHSQRLNSEAIVAFVKALCKVSISELQSPTDPRVFSLTKIVEIAHYNMSRIRLVWSHIWNVLADFFVRVGLYENLSVAIFVMDSLRQLAMKFLEREELANYNFQNEFLQPFVIIMQKSSSTEIRELIVRCISQMVLSRVNNVKSGWRSVFVVFSVAAADERKNVVLLAFETMERIVRDYFPYIIETETTTFTDCVKCLIAFTKSRFNNDASLNAIAFLRFCAVKLADGLDCHEYNSESLPENGDLAGDKSYIRKDDHVQFWIPLLSGLSKLTSDPRLTIRKGALEVLFNILKDHGHLFSSGFWANIFKIVIYPIFSNSLFAGEEGFPQLEKEEPSNNETDALAAECLVDLFVNFFDVVRPELTNVSNILAGFLQSPQHRSASTGIASLLHLSGNLGSKFSENEWRGILLALREASLSTLNEFSKMGRIMDDIEIPDSDNQSYSDAEQNSDFELENNEEASMATASYAIVRLKRHIAVQLLIVRASMKLFDAHQNSLSASHLGILLEVLSSISLHAAEVSSAAGLLRRLRKASALLEVSEPPVVHFENEAHQNYIEFLQALGRKKISVSGGSSSTGDLLVGACEKSIEIYLACSGNVPGETAPAAVRWVLPLGSAKKEELAARTKLAAVALRALGGLDLDDFRRNLWRIFPKMVDLVRSEHSSGEVQGELFEMFVRSIGPLVIGL